MNFIFFYPDEMRAESVSCYGHPLVKMPNYDRVAKEGVMFEQCHIQHPVCTPSRCSLMTGWYPHVGGHRTLWHLLRNHEPSLFRYLKEAGYHIEWYGKNDLYAQDYFEGVVDVAKSEKAIGQAGACPYEEGTPGHYSFLREAFSGSCYETGDMQNVQTSIDFLHNRKKGDKPFFMYLPLTMPHPSYSAPEPFHSMYNPKDLSPLRPAGIDGKPDYHSLIRKYRGLDQLPEGAMEKIQAVYLGMNSYVDWMLGRLLEALDETGLDEDTVLIISSDHGDWAGDYGLVEKWPSALDDTITHVPLLIRMPENKSGHIVKEQVELFDIMATVLDIAKIEPSHVHFAKSLVPQLMGAPGDKNRAVFAEGGYDTHELHCFEGSILNNINLMNPKHVYYPKALQQQECPKSVCRSTMIRTLEYKLIKRPQGVSELYDLRTDSQELCNLYENPKYTDIKRELEERLLNWYIHTSDVVPLDIDKRGLPPQVND